jgi:CRP/FNR family transcriptional regulator
MIAREPEVRFELADRELAQFLPGFPPAFLRRLSAGKRAVVYEPGEVAFRAGTRADPGVVVDGLLRQSVWSVTGKQATLRYIRPGGLLGTGSLFGPINFTVIALERSTIVHFDLDAFRKFAGENPAVAMSVAHTLSELASDLADAAAKFAFMSVEQRVVDHLLSLASTANGYGGALVANVTQQQLADAAGTAREVVARILRVLRIEGKIEESRGMITIRDKVGLLNR